MDDNTQLRQFAESGSKEREMRAFEESQIADAGTTTEAAWEELQPHLAERWCSEEARASPSHQGTAS